MKKFISLLFLIYSTHIMSQNKYSVTIELDLKTHTHLDEDIYITGSFNAWKPKQDEYKFKKKSNKYSLVLNDISEGLFDYKFSRGSWKTLDCTIDGRLENLRETEITKDTVIRAEIVGWRDDFPESTASKNLFVLDDNFYIPQLNRNRRIWIYLPENYNQNTERYPVIYMHDGQDLFDESISEGRLGPVEWAVDETMDNSKKQSIIIAIDHEYKNNTRKREYYFLPNKDIQNPEGKKYIEFIVETLKPYVDKNYRTLSDVKNTTIAGGSLGGLVSLYAGVYHPETFGNIGVFSPSFWLDDDNLINEIHKLPKKQKCLIEKQTYYFYGGKRENRKKPDGSVVQMNVDIQNFLDAVKSDFKPTIKIEINPKGKHGGWYWRYAFKWMYEEIAR